LGVHCFLELLGTNTDDAIWTASGPDSLMIATEPCCAPTLSVTNLMLLGKLVRKYAVVSFCLS